MNTTPVRVGIVEATMADDGPLLRSVWVDRGILLVAYDPRWLSRDLAAMVIRRDIGDYIDIDAADAFSTAGDGAR